MADLISFVISFIIVVAIPYYFSKRADERQSRETYRKLNKQSQNEMEKWRK